MMALPLCLHLREDVSPALALPAEVYSYCLLLCGVVVEDGDSLLSLYDISPFVPGMRFYQ